MIKYPRLFLMLFLVNTISIINVNAQAKNYASKENELINLYSQLFKLSQGGNDSAYDVSEKFEKELTEFIEKNPSTLSYTFKKLIDNNVCYINTSSDGKLRIYSWNSWTGGTMQVFRNIYQWKANGKVFTNVPERQEGDPASYCSKIYTVTTTNKNYYLAITNGVFSSSDSRQDIIAYSIDDNKLQDTAKIFKTKTKKLSNISISYNSFNLSEQNRKLSNLILYNEVQKKIYIPVVGVDGKVSNSNLVYQLKGNYFEYQGIAK